MSAPHRTSAASMNPRLCRGDSRIARQSCQPALIRRRAASLCQPPIRAVTNGRHTVPIGISPDFFLSSRDDFQKHRRDHRCQEDDEDGRRTDLLGDDAAGQWRVQISLPKRHRAPCYRVRGTYIERDDRSNWFYFIASIPRSFVLIRTASMISEMKILPSPTLPV
ncbi:hypothetical protein SAMN02745823_02847 [Sporobacter termitidis DSM 10068]|uniref:Uncharacterized protein n=1 Tax=Sporobacter termitidis DSM 10068 TaxID=1123282 RepID=A0A1M5YTG4_9FIRM|nr:hypothetical protein SAMN02745823_02847 [Sporobacter termitidis DSM 10068]